MNTMLVSEYLKERAHVGVFKLTWEVHIKIEFKETGCEINLSCPR
jgi:hypothetical protein